MPSNDTPPRPFVPKTEAERESVKALVDRAMRRGYDAGASSQSLPGWLGMDDEIDRVVPKVPRVKRRVELHGNRSVSLNGIRGDGSVVYFVHDGDNHGCAEFHELILQSPAIHRVNVAKALIDVLHAPDEPAQPAAAQGGAKLTWEQLSDFAVSIQRVTKAGGWNSDVTPAEVATLNAKLASLLGAVPVGRAYPVYGYAVVHRDETISTHAAGPTRDTSATLAAAKRAALPGNVIHTLYDGGPIDALRGLAPTVTP